MAPTLTFPNIFNEFDYFKYSPVLLARNAHRKSAKSRGFLPLDLSTIYIRPFFGST